MLKHKDHFHGSDFEEIERIYQIPREEIISFSANVNPLGLSPLLKSSLAEKIDAITSYPDREYTALRGCIGAYTGADPAHILVGNGSTELISLFTQTLHPKKALIIGPTYSEYEREVSLGGGTSLYYPLREKDDFKLRVDDLCGQLNESIDLLVICNPNNPTSTAIPQQEMRTILDVCKQYDITVMVDETYVEFAPAAKKIDCIPLTKYYNNLILLRGISKFFAAPGLRLGYAVTGNQDFIKTINTLKNPWTINSLAAVAGELMFTDEDYIRKTSELINTERARMLQTVERMDTLKTYTPMANFMLIKILRPDVTSQQLFDHAIRNRCMIRDCSTFPFLDDKYIRFCFMLPEQNDKLLKCLREVLEA